MKRAITYLIFLAFPALAVSQSTVETDLVEKGPEQITLTAYDLVTPVLLRGASAEYNSSGFLNPIANNSGLAFISSAAVPGLGQAANRHWLKSGLFLAIEITSIYMIVDYRNRGIRGERNYENWADQNWSVVQYANWLVEYHDIHGINNPYLEELKSMVDGANPAFNTGADWAKVDIGVLRDVERNTPYLTTDQLAANKFSHVLPDYGSQQYYELIAKYYQYQAGWKDYHTFHNDLGHSGDLFNQRYLIDRNGEFASHLFYDGVDRAQRFNDHFRTGRHFMSLLIANHLFSAFDAYFSVKLKQNRLKATPSLLPGQQIKLAYRF